MLEEQLTERILGCAIEVHRHLGPGLLESTYEACLGREMGLRGLAVRHQVQLPLEYKGLTLEDAYRMDIVVEERVVLEVKTVDSLQPIHKAQLLTYLRLSGHRVGLLINFNCPTLKTGILRMVL